MKGGRGRKINQNLLIITIYSKSLYMCIYACIYVYTQSVLVEFLLITLLNIINSCKLSPSGFTIIKVESFIQSLIEERLSGQLNTGCHIPLKNIPAKPGAQSSTY